MSKWEHKRAVFEEYRKSLTSAPQDFSTHSGGYIYSGHQIAWKAFCAALDHMEAEDKKLAKSEILHANKLADGTLWYVGCPLHIPPENFFTKSGTLVKAQLVEVQQGEQSPSSAPAEQKQKCKWKQHPDGSTWMSCQKHWPLIKLPVYCCDCSRMVEIVT